MADARHNRRDESRFKNSYLLRLSYKILFPNDEQRLKEVLISMRQFR
ncbi:hypothetical protein MTBBW1_1150019 [Desulfamplus magnetovallimortis]|uniref:Uncharacterized protein n=1 Tax=Desulfamplus magnetovallimortis TaxID=1246637 RepID=A0A1W1H5Y2_9BACT|nr:hypothetical protein MTBBW1_1150019 [Desulfamplus magnetovallimortis]